MTAIVAVHPKIYPVVQDCLMKTHFTPVSIQSHLSPSKNVHELFTLLRKSDASLLILDTLLLPKEHCIDTLRRLRLGNPGLRIILLSPQMLFIKQHRNELALLQIFDTLPYKANTSGLLDLQDSLPLVLLHPADAMSFLEKSVFEPIPKKQICSFKNFITVAGLEERAGTTKTAFLLSLFMRKEVLLVELNAKHPVFLNYFLLEEYYDHASGLYYLPNYPNLALLPLEKSNNWTSYIDNFRYIILDLGVLSSHASDPCYQEFQRSSMSILTSFSSPWNLQNLNQLNLPREDIFLWLNFCPKKTYKIIQKNLEDKYSTIVCAPYQPNWFIVSKEQENICQKLFLNQ